LSSCCNQRFTTFERVQFREITVIKKNGRKSPFDRDKLTRSVMISLRKRPVDSDTIEKFVSKIYRNLEDLGQNEVMSTTIGKFVMDGLKEIDPVAYVRFASVYTNFKEVKDFEEFVDKINVPKIK
jgi:transcriptional repressor NrdR